MDTTANMLTKIRNASSAEKQEVLIPFSKLQHEIAKVLGAYGFIKEAEMTKDDKRKFLKIILNPERRLLSIKRISKPGQRIYVPYKEIRIVRSGLGIGIYSTSQGVMSNIEARQKKIGGEYLCEVY